MEMVTDRTRSSSANLLLLLTLSTASKVIAKGGKRLQVDGGAYQCRTCDRQFSTFQALGGHRSSHKRPKVRADGLDLLLGARPGKAARPIHQCATCGIVFSSGQALGGHMRRHKRVARTWTEVSTSSSSSGLSDQLVDEPVTDVFTRRLIQFI